MRKIGFFWEMNAGQCFRIQRKAWMDSGYLFMCQSTEAFGNISHMLYVKVSNDPDSGDMITPLQSRDFTALCGVYNAPDNLGNPYPCEPIDLDPLVLRDTWSDTNMAAVNEQAKNLEGAVKGLETVGLGWTSEKIDVSVDALLAALQVQARSPDKFMTVTDLSVTAEAGGLKRRSNAQIRHCRCICRKVCTLHSYLEIRALLL
jgi:hypothetical protein